jgi:hypothetical protein
VEAKLGSGKEGKEEVGVFSCVGSGPKNCRQNKGTDFGGADPSTVGLTQELISGERTQVPWGRPKKCYFVWERTQAQWEQTQELVWEQPQEP